MKKALILQEWIFKERNFKEINKISVNKKNVYGKINELLKQHPNDKIIFRISKIAGLDKYN